MSRPSRSRPLTTPTNLSSIFRVNLSPGWSTRIPTNMIALYWAYGFSQLSFDRNFLIILAASFAATGLDSVPSTIGGRWRTSSPCLIVRGVFGYVTRSYRIFMAPGFTEEALASCQLYVDGAIIHHTTLLATVCSGPSFSAGA